jgi:hypothetical protein
MTGASARNTWQVIVGFFLGGFAAQSLGIAGIALYQSFHGHFDFVHLLYLSWRERFFWASVPIVPAVLLWRRRPLVSVGMLLYAAFVWFASAPSPWAK